ncbi:MAG: methionyl-tRNA formyltransferase [Clostridiales bacterium]|nr:methionyl-tRNA formyltransferase [Clostridiales bacterium]
MRLIYMGTPDFAVPPMEMLAQAGHEIIYAVTQPDAVRDRGKKVKFSPVKEKAIELGIPVLQPSKIRKNEEFAQLLRDAAPDAAIVAAYGKILPADILNIPKYGCLNIHGSLLPRFRGAAPIQAAIIAGDEETGVTIMRMNEGLDTGDMVAKAATPIGSKTCEDLHDELAMMGAKLITETLEDIEGAFKGAEKQDDALSTYAPMISKADGHIDFSRNPEEIERRIRAFDPWPGSYAEMNGKTFKLWKAVALDRETDAAAGTVVAAGKEGLDISAGGRVLRVTQIQAPGKKRMETGDYLRGNVIEIGTVLR